ncbi:hypothetical protein A2960_03435 [Candidatus Gottesmanbacteria bacterium RIFCSPLOWO2_01_FULL_39_12b]|uniref:EamA domain-containing protein n=1 Tax=Candidatus Gottesmanbacteria bacterium RIFCSPLOWO2_01_FULL_39_12b TaxID=1798388 RepID=A0A1F6ANW5_9BACT|nr:MAG: hypothetical protein A2960_03435 [Candidatus Gottesmanbacteria bacterium RIFCSPLOWO2_01_FULL_39_12b]
MPGILKKGIIFSLITAIISGFAIFYNKLIIVKGIDPLIFNIIKNGGVAIILSSLFLSISNRNKLLSLTFSQWKKLISIGFIGGFIPFVLYFEGLKTVAATNANLIHKTLFIWVAIMALPILKERLNFWQIVGFVIIAWSNLFIGGFTGFSGNKGEIMILSATILWSIENVIAKITLKNIDSEIVSWGRMFIGTVFLVLLAVAENKLIFLTKLNSSQILPIAGSILLLTGYVYFWFKALKFAPATIVTSVLILSTPITNVLSAIFITHNLPQVHLFNAIFTIIGLVFITLILPRLSQKEAATI